MPGKYPLALIDQHRIQPSIPTHGCNNLVNLLRGVRSGIAPVRLEIGQRHMVNAALLPLWRISQNLHGTRRLLLAHQAASLLRTVAVCVCRTRSR